MRYISTRGLAEPLGFSDAVATGLAPDGGLFLPETLPDLSAQWPQWAGLGYAELCYQFMRLFATDIPPDTLRHIVEKSYRGFDHADTAPLVALDSRTYVLELFHGPTLAFKDFAMQLLGNLYEHQCAQRGESINVLGATSGDTGAAAIHALLGKPGTAIFILYPDGRVSPLQERQMTCTGADNVFALAIDGSFDDAQAALKTIFGDTAFRLKNRLSAVNSINLARVLAQCIYYLYAWLRLPADARASAEFVVPTGNFGNVLAGWLLQRMGVPIPAFKVATNQNDILYRLFTTGEYRVADVQPSLAPSMDIQVASNFERFLYYQLGGAARAASGNSVSGGQGGSRGSAASGGSAAEAAARVRDVMAACARDGAYRFEHFDRSTFSASRCTDAQIPSIIAHVRRRYGYLVDPHTACAFADLSPEKTSVVLATASPAKFPETIGTAIGAEPKHPRLEALRKLPIVKHRLPASVEAITDFVQTHAV